MLDLSKRLDARIVLASTSEVYGSPTEHPQTETYWGNVNPVGPRSCYDEAKRLAEAMALAYENELNISVGIARIFNTYGPRMRPDDGRVVSNFVVQALRGNPMTIYGSGNQTRSFQYVSDLIEGLKKLMASNVTGPINIGNPQEISIHQLSVTIAEILNISSSSVREFYPLPVDDPPRRRPSIGKAKELLDWSPKIKVREGLGATIDYFRKSLHLPNRS